MVLPWLRAEGLAVRIKGIWLGALGLWGLGSGLGFGVQSLRSRVWSLGFFGALGLWGSWGTGS